MINSEKVRKKEKLFLTGYFVASDPNPDASIEYIKNAINAGMDAIEIGIPSADPYLEGDIIKRAHERKYPDFKETQDIYNFFDKLRPYTDGPIWVMGYYNEVINSELYKLLAERKLVDGFIVPDLPINEMKSIRQNMKKFQTELIPVINNKMSEEDLNIALSETKLVYCQIHTGKTGTQISNFNDLPFFFDKIKSKTDAKLMAGFGIKNADLAQSVWKHGFEGVVVGSEIVKLVEMNDMEGLSELVESIVKSKEFKGV
ncbi:tryptophan synthase subunit alpha [Metaplanococcus flavidus]|uniref:tryptophan synthase n=1 Tax=Metaplanococcus flavidus TaxID=569883 RepID=A0ABW3L6I2_9BACL